MPLPMTIKVSRLIGVTREFIAGSSVEAVAWGTANKKTPGAGCQLKASLPGIHGFVGVKCPDCAVRFTHPGRKWPMVVGDHLGCAAEGLAAVARGFAGSVP